MQKHILLVSFLPPMPGTGSPIILKRHLSQLELQGWKISIVVPESSLRNTNKFSSSWQIIPLTGRKWWWPPVRREISGLLKMRLPLWRWECEQYLVKERPSVILTCLWDIYPLLALHLSQSWNVPLSVIIHDQEEVWAKSEDERCRIRQRSLTILNKAARIWPVSSELAKVYNLNNTEKSSVLYPIPEKIDCSFVEWKSNFQSHPVVAHAGSLHPFQFTNFLILAQSLQKINGILLIIASGDNPTLTKLLDICPNVKYHEPFEQNKDVISFLSDNASCILVSYSFSLVEQPWAATSFPSKLVEFSKLGLPILILSPRSTAISKWAERTQWLAHITQLDNAEILNTIVKLTNQESWMQISEQTQKFALDEFNPERIHSQFVSELPDKIF
ncbi:hypothetical protein [Nostoc sp. TCL240-02]|uniref:hypothetical protein n=1 Tax=Nostoc sp. TCL240-02 TaxID=2572090 RepID=UPI00157F9D8D|nr:hypothetical protein [Nostoc sp. TCL240-02]QKQ75871.1 glycosyltransferase family 4 protein [Nostoc sp. TCL240-02]